MPDECAALLLALGPLATSAARRFAARAIDPFQHIRTMCLPELGDAVEQDLRDAWAATHLQVVLADDPAMVARLPLGDFKADSTLIIAHGQGTGDVPPAIAARATVVVAPEGMAGLEAAALAWLGFWSNYCFGCAEAEIEDWAQPGLKGRVFDWTEPSAGGELPDELRAALQDPGFAAALWLHRLGVDTGLDAYWTIYVLLRDTAGREDVPVAGAWTVEDESIERLCAVVLFYQGAAPDHLI